MAQAISPQRLMPIHTERPGRYTELFGRVQFARNREWVEV